MLIRASRGGGRGAVGGAREVIKENLREPGAVYGAT